MTRIRMGLVPGLLLVLALALAACGGGDKPSGVASLGGDKATATTSPGGSKDLKQLALAYARCMRQHGINLPDPKIDAAGRVAQQMPSDVGPDAPKFKAANEACKQYLPDGGQSSPLPVEERQLALAYAKCMRQHGINLPDPQFTADGIDQQLPTGMDEDDPRLKAADQACQQYQPNGGDKQTQQQSSGGSR